MKHALLTVSLLMTFVCFWSALAFAVRAIQLRKLGLPLWPFSLVSPFQHLLSAGPFSEVGLRARRLALAFGVALLVFAALDFVLL